MKTLFTIVIVLGAGFWAGCSDNSSGGGSTFPLIGNWELRSQVGGLMPGQTFKEGNGTMLKFTASTYERYSNWKLEKSGTYSIVREKSFVNDRVLPRIIYDDQQDASKTYFEIKDDRLVLYAGASIAVDGIELAYARKQYGND